MPNRSANAPVKFNQTIMNGARLLQKPLTRRPTWRGLRGRSYERRQPGNDRTLPSEASEHLQFLREYSGILQDPYPLYEDIERLYISAHGVAGTGGTYGYEFFKRLPANWRTSSSMP